MFRDIPAGKLEAIAFFPDPEHIEHIRVICKKIKLIRGDI
jgi:hypothetical protein